MLRRLIRVAADAELERNKLRIKQQKAIVTAAIVEAFKK